MAHATRVPVPRSPLDGRWGLAAAIAAVIVLVLVVKPWSVARETDSSPEPTSRPTATRTPPLVAPTGRPYDLSSLGPRAPEPAWELWAGDRVTRIRFIGPADGFSPGASVGPGATAIVAGPVIDLGEADDLTTLLLNRPADVDIGAVRLWRFVEGGLPERVELMELADPWSAAHVRVFGLRARGLARGTVAPWRPGLYRLDLLIEPADRARTLLLNVRPSAGEPPDGADRPLQRPDLDVELLRRLPPEAELWAFGQYLTGWSRRSLAAPCRVTEIWRASDPDAPCHATPVGRPTAMGVNLGGGGVVTSFSVMAVDPLPGPVDAPVTLAVNDVPGLAMTRVTSGRFADGIYRLEATTARGRTLRWYVEVGPDPLD